MEEPIYPEESRSFNTSYEDQIRAADAQQISAANFLEQINPARIAFEVDKMLQGKFKDTESGKWVDIIEGEELLPARLRLRIITTVMSLFNQSTAFSNLSEGEINNIMSTLIENLRDTLEDNHEQLNGDDVLISEVMFNICSMVFILLKRAMNGLESKRIFDSMKIGESRVVGSPEKKSLLQKLRVVR